MSTQHRPLVSVGTPDGIAADLRGQLLSAVRRVCPRWLADYHDDIVHAALMKVLDAWRTGEGNRALSSSYLWRVAYTTTIDEIRRIRRRRESDIDDLKDDTIVDPALSPEQRVAGHQLGLAIADCLARLARDRRVAVTLHLQGHTVPECGRLLGWSAKRAENLVYRGLHDLRACLSTKGVKP